MAVSVKEQSHLRKSALTAGISLIIMAMAAFFSYSFIHGRLVIPEDASATFTNIKSASILFKTEILGWIIILITDIFVSWAFYIFLKPIDKSLSLLGAWLRLIYAAILGDAIVNLIYVLLLSRNTDYSSLFKMDQLQGLMLLFLKEFDAVWSFGLIIFGGHLLIVGYLAWKSDSIPKVISILLLLASAGYIMINLFKTFFPYYHGVITSLQIIFCVPMIAGELGFGIWLLFKGGKILKGNTTTS
ncbi:DUF4386 domain-containing protein [Bacillus sp. BRMEA1]|uniref:DUF4386 domain-containing protein n=1 Tax=Neobacillus endophyticus TaxID=2738405 RepID=UPI0015664FDC|nr:DUF4386 domain-containing protein [Neobacillus endophyticus]NRD78174.1 DUF4386 domain-containing protein [Neobacillus endophyticus]